MEYRCDTIPTQDHRTSLRRNGHTSPPLLRAVRCGCFAAPCWLYLVLSLLVVCLLNHPHLPSILLPCRQRPLNCSTVSCARHTGIIIYTLLSTFSLYHLILPRILQSSELSNNSSVNRYISHLFINTCYYMPHMTPPSLHTTPVTN